MEEEIKNTTTLEDLTDGYKEGAIAGAIVGVVLSAILGRKMLIGAVIGMIGGGYIGHIIKKSQTESTESTEFNIQ